MFGEDTFGRSAEIAHEIRIRLVPAPTDRPWLSMWDRLLAPIDGESKPGAIPDVERNGSAEIIKPNKREIIEFDANE